MKHFDEAATRAPLGFKKLVPALRAAFSAEARVPPRHVHSIEAAGADKGTVLIMPAWSDAGFLGIKTINIFPGNGARGLPGLHATYVLYDAHTGVPLAMMDGNEITARRTAAASALGASFLAREDARRLLLLGTGRIARMLPAAHASVRPIDEVAVWNHRPEGAEALAAQLRTEGWNARAATDLEAAVRHADIVSCATLASAPLVRGEWLAPGSHLDLIGSFTPAMREADVQCFVGARTFIDTNEALQKSGDLLDAIAAGTLRAQEVQGTLAELCRGQRPGRTGSEERTVFKAVGSALEDLAAATLVWQHAASEVSG
ncbi:ornithine cyclodeaminase/alanine dehydrogenase-like protein (mu-crystallin family) [Variovorax boronicumulans]|uniref:ornithine cyclodeaminase family protein n=1 Tax=Variovorax boronicumulans TaxID=436515 RepID=UPI0024739248|nr:ornithine cyclodeaminase family protein [Variovorax boronicumulans]MDH6169365.1 ornithine cyclodeaminase/alanine dehydrogenase-like protein (mu-crystallin family) [Variovorax boronicumulans]